jgi:hypothetical protein
MGKQLAWKQKDSQHHNQQQYEGDQQVQQPLGNSHLRIAA